MPGLHLCLLFAHGSRALIHVGYTAVKCLSWTYDTLMPGWRVCLLFVHLTMGSRRGILGCFPWSLNIPHARPACVLAISATCSELSDVMIVRRAQRKKLQATCFSCTCAMTALWDRCAASISNLKSAFDVVRASLQP